MFLSLIDSSQWKKLKSIRSMEMQKDATKSVTKSVAITFRLQLMDQLVSSLCAPQDIIFFTLLALFRCL